jgi:hypothetical protein
MDKISFNSLTTNLNGLLEYNRSLGKFGLLEDGCIVRIKLWSTTVDPQELHFNWRRKSEWAYVTNFLAFSERKKHLRKFKKVLNSIGKI